MRLDFIRRKYFRSHEIKNQRFSVMQPKDDLNH